MSDFAIGIDNWAEGVVRAIEKDRVAEKALVSAKNTQFWKIGQGQSVLGTRPGARLVAQLAATSRLATNTKWMFPYNHPVNDSTSFNRYLVLVDADGSVRFKDPDDTWDETDYPLGSTGLTAFSADETSMVDAATINGRLMMVAGMTRRSAFGKAVRNFGVTPAQASVSVELLGSSDLATSNLPYDEYDLYITGYDPLTGAESNPTYLGEFSTRRGEATDDKLLRIRYASGSTNAQQYRIYIQRLSTMAQPYLVTPLVIYRAKGSGAPPEGENVTSTGDIWASTYQDVVVNLTGEELADLITPMPSLTENSLMPSDVTFLAAYGQRLIGASRRKLYWSKLNVPDAFPPENAEIVTTVDGAEIVGILPVEEELLLVFTLTGVYGLMGNDPQYWKLQPIDPNVGCVHRRSIVKFDGGVAWWSPQFGPVIMQGGQVEKIGLELLGKLKGSSDAIVGGWDPSHEHLAWAFPNEGDVEASRMAVFNYRVGKWCAQEWDPFTISSMATGWANDGQQRLFVGDGGYRIYYFDTASKYDGAPGGTLTGTFVAGSGEISSISGTGFYSTTVNGQTVNLARQRVTIVGSDGLLVARRTISTNNGTALTLDRSVLVTSGATYTYYISTPYVEVRFGELDAGQAFLRKRFDRLYVDVQASYPVPIYVQTMLNRNDVSNQLTLSVTPVQGSTATLDATWDVPVITTTPFVKKRLNVFKNGHTMEFILSQAQPEQVVLSRLMITGRYLSDRYYA